MGFVFKCITVAVLGALCDVLASLHIRALVSSALVMAIGTVLAINYLGFVAHLWFVESPELSKRLAITTAGAVGAGIGTAIVLLADL